MSAQTHAPAAWVVVDTGSTDATVEVARELARERPWLALRSTAGARVPTRGGPIVRAFTTGVATLDGGRT